MIFTPTLSHILLDDLAYQPYMVCATLCKKVSYLLTKTAFWKSIGINYHVNMGEHIICIDQSGVDFLRYCWKQLLASHIKKYSRTPVYRTCFIAHVYLSTVDTFFENQLQVFNWNLPPYSWHLSISDIFFENQCNPL